MQVGKVQQQEWKVSGSHFHLDSGTRERENSWTNWVQKWSSQYQEEVAGPQPNQGSCVSSTPPPSRLHPIKVTSQAVASFGDQEFSQEPRRTLCIKTTAICSQHMAVYTCFRPSLLWASNIIAGKNKRTWVPLQMSSEHTFIKWPSASSMLDVTTFLLSEALSLDTFLRWFGQKPKDGSGILLALWSAFTILYMMDLASIGNLGFPVRALREMLLSVKEDTAIHIWAFTVAIAQRTSVSLFFLLLNREVVASVRSLMYCMLTAWNVMPFKHMGSFVFTIVHIILNDVTMLVTIYIQLV